MNTQAPLVSIVIPVFNGADYVAQAIESALSQTYENCEVIVVNDGSNDANHTQTIIDSFGERIQCIAQKNGGVAAALNTGIRAMRGKYFSWLSHDDVYLPRKIEIEIDHACTTDAPTVFYGDFETIDAAGHHLETHVAPDLPPKALRPSLMRSANLHGCTLLIPRVAFDRVGLFNESLRTTQDYDLWFRMAEQFPFMHIPETLVQARIHPNQDTNRLKTQVVRDVNRLYGRYIRTLRRDEIDAYWPNGVFDYFIETAKSMQERRYRGAAASALLMAIRHLDAGRGQEVLRRALSLARDGLLRR
ncbi:MAG: glycosyltransferase [Thiobacillus sp.]|nr:glycosyltransferase [Thiobacillus sp.]